VKRTEGLRTSAAIHQRNVQNVECKSNYLFERVASARDYFFGHLGSVRVRGVID
jgi:hypothetical protein